MRDWAGVRAPLHTTDHLRVPNRIAFVLLGVAVVLLVVLLLPEEKQSINVRTQRHMRRIAMMSYSQMNTTYPNSLPLWTTEGEKKLRIATVADLDKESAVRNSEKGVSSWRSYLRRGWLILSKDNENARVEWDPQPISLTSRVSEGGRGMELSELIFYNGKLLAVDDRTGIIFQLPEFSCHTCTEIKAVSWSILSDGPGSVGKGFKAEWMTIKDSHVLVGGLGKPWTTVTGEYQNDHPQWIKKIGPNGGVKHLNWATQYEAIKSATGIKDPGYLIHESAAWSDQHNSWFFLPRRASSEQYNDQDDEHRATNMLIKADEKFKHISVERIGILNPTVGFSSFKFVPGTNDHIIIAVKSEEDQGKIASYVMVFNLDGVVLLEPARFDNVKYEGIEFI
jgi:soluble calcium-activated nucleotidase 1